MTQLIASNLPIYFQCLCAPTEWTRAKKPFRALRAALANLPPPETVELDSDFLQAHQKPGVATTFDPWEKRNEFFRLKTDDTAALLEFLPTVGLFEAGTLPFPPDAAKGESLCLIRASDGHVYNTHFLAKTSERYIWGMQRLLMNALQNLETYKGASRDFQVRIVHEKKGPRVTLTTLTFLESLLLTLAVDKVQRAKVRKCARPDCGVLFSITGGHKRKYCEWYCGHIESVRKQRRKAQQAKKKARQESITSASLKGK